MAYNTTIIDLCTKHENQIKAFEQHQQEMLKARINFEKEILLNYGCSYADAPADAWRIINALREDYYRYWSNDGQLINELMRRQMRDLGNAIRQLQ